MASEAQIVRRRPSCGCDRGNTLAAVIELLSVVAYIDDAKSLSRSELSP